MLDALPRTAFALLAGSAAMKSLASRYGMRQPTSFARRFIAGETVSEAIDVAQTIEKLGLSVTLDVLGESAVSTTAAAEATRAYVAMIGDLERAGVARNVSLKLTQLGLGVDRATSIDNLRRVLDVANTAGFFVRIDMEGSAHTDLTFETFETVWGIGYRNVGVVVQSALRRSEQDVRRLNDLRAGVRLVKGAYREPRAVAYQQKAKVDAAFLTLMQLLLSEGVSPAIATHDPALIGATKQFAESRGLRPATFEFQMLYGIRRDLQAALAGEGYKVRIYVPFGKEWFPYFMRRLGERPANVSFVVKSLLRERRRTI
ncbi:MAG TPA: proline dehydrogenase family protein [Vicinamibacterales bacterium]|nr:proline dehydrogenase family protein [Vicinamibacterales bacterium]